MAEATQEPSETKPLEMEQPLMTEEFTERFIKANQIKELYEALKLQNKSQISSLSHFVLPSVCSFFTEQSSRDDPDGCVYAEKILALSLNSCDPRELLCLLCDQLHAAPTSDVKFRALLKPIKRCIAHMKNKKGHSLALALDAIGVFVSSLPLPEEHSLEGNERLLLDCDANVERATFVISDLLSFLSPFVQEVAWTDSDVASNRAGARKQIDELTRFLLRTFNHPLVYLDLTIVLRNGEVSKSLSRVCAETSLELLSQLQPDFMKTIISLHDERVTRERTSQINVSVTKDDTVAELGLAAFSYLVFADGAHAPARCCVPVLYTARFLFESNLPFVLALLQKAGHSLVVHKGLLLCAGLMRRMEQCRYEADFLECLEVRELVRCLVYIAASTKLKEFSEYSLQLLASLVKLFDDAGRNRLLHFLLKMSPQVGVIGHVVLMLREEIFENHERCSSPNSFAGADLSRLLMVVFALPKAEKSDLLDHSERIMSALNLFRAVATRDVISVNATGIWDLVPMIERKYFAVLRAGINLSRSHYRLEIGKVRDAQRLERTGGRKEVKVAKDGEVELSWKQQLGVLEMAVETFDMMEAVLNHLSELINGQKKEQRDAETIEAPSQSNGEIEL